MIRVYRNLRRNCLSVLHRTERGWRLWKHVDNIELENVQFTVSRSGRERVLRERRKNVHAFVEGNLSTSEITDSNPRLVKYNPYIADYFFDKETKKPVREASHAFVSPKGILAVNLK
jgi:hypothetical protein